MLSKIKEYYHDGMAVVITNPTYYILASIVEMIILLLIIYKWSPLGISENYPALANIFVLMFAIFQVLTYLFVQNKNMFSQAGIKNRCWILGRSNKNNFYYIDCLCKCTVNLCIYMVDFHSPKHR